MALVLTDAGATQILTSYFKKTQPAGGDNLTLKLFVNDITPADDDVVGDYMEAVGGGYAAKTLTAGSWSIAPNAGVIEASYAEQVWLFTGGLTTNTTIYGYYIVDADNVLIYAEKAAATFEPANNTGYIVAPKMKLSWGNPA